jgi:hypothetical protein
MIGRKSDGSTQRTEVGAAHFLWMNCIGELALAVQEDGKTGNIVDHLRIDYLNQIGPIAAWVTLETVTLTNTRNCISTHPASARQPGSTGLGQCRELRNDNSFNLAR